MPVSITLPTPSVTGGPTYANQINTALTTLAAATHTGGANGDKWTAASLNIDGNVSWGGYSVTSLKATTYTQQASAIATANSTWVKTDGNLWFTNGSGTAIQLTSGGTLNTSALITSVYSQLALSTNLTIASTDTYTHYLVDTSSPRTITLPTAASVGAGRYYIFTNVAGNGTFTLTRAGSDTIEGGTTFVSGTNQASVQLVSDGSSKWYAVTKDATTARPGSIVLGTDLAGTAGNPTVVALTGAAGVVSIRSTAATLQWANNTSSPTLSVAGSTTTTQTLYITGQPVTGAYDGGDVQIGAGSTSNGANHYGSASLNSGAASVHVRRLSGARAVAGIHAKPTATNVPGGDGVTFFANKTTAPAGDPASEIPVGGFVLWSDAGYPAFKASDGNPFIIDQIDNTKTTIGAQQATLRVKIWKSGALQTYHIPIYAA